MKLAKTLFTTAFITAAMIAGSANAASAKPAVTDTQKLENAITKLNTKVSNDSIDDALSAKQVAAFQKDLSNAQTKLTTDESLRANGDITLAQYNSLVADLVAIKTAIATDQKPIITITQVSDRITKLSSNLEADYKDGKITTAQYNADKAKLTTLSKNLGSDEKIITNSKGASVDVITLTEDKSLNVSLSNVSDALKVQVVPVVQ